MAIDVEKAGDTATLKPEGDLDVHTAGAFYTEVTRLRKDRAIAHLVIDFAAVNQLESAGIAVVALATEEFAEDGGSVTATNLSPDHETALTMMPTRLRTHDTAGDIGFFEDMGDKGFKVGESALELVELLYDSFAVMLRVLRRKDRLPPGSLVEQSVLIGVDAFLIIALLSFLLGLIMAFQSAYQLQQFGANIYVANLVGISMVREFGPMMTAIMLAGRSGSAIAAELGTMTVQEEVDALRTMGIDPVRYLVAPRLLALSLVQPLLTIMADFVGILGGFVIGTLYLDLSASAYFDQTVEALTLNDFSNGLSKSMCFAWIIGITGCYTGLTIQGGASGVGRATTRSVVTSIFLIIVADSIWTTVATVVRDV